MPLPAADEASLARDGDFRSVTDMGRFYFELCCPAISRASSLMRKAAAAVSPQAAGRFQRNQKHRSFIAPAASSALTWRAPAGPPEARRPVAVEAPAGVEALGDQNVGDRARVGRHELPELAVRGGSALMGALPGFWRGERRPRPTTDGPR